MLIFYENRMPTIIILNRITTKIRIENKETVFRAGIWAFIKKIEIKIDFYSYSLTAVRLL